VGADTKKESGMKTNATRKNRRPAGEHRSERDRLDASHDSDARGEHRYADAHQTEAEQKARRDRDDLKRSLGGHSPLSPRRRR
jgi:hypothetical protein